VLAAPRAGPGPDYLNTRLHRRGVESAESDASARRRYALYVVVSALVFVQPLSELMWYAAHSELHSHILLVPFVTGYLLYEGRAAQSSLCQPSLGGTLVFGTVAAAAAAAALWSRDTLSVNDSLALMTLSFVSVVTAGGFLFLGATWMATVAFPITFLIFLIPLPDGLVNAFEMTSVRASADVSAALLRALGTPMLRDGNLLALPGIVIEVARECSGIRSTWVLLITSALVSHLTLEGGWRRAALVATVIPLGIVRNSVRIVVIVLLCVYVDPRMIDSAIHRQGGPLFFALSLGPLFMFLWLLRRAAPRRSVAR